MHIALLCSRSSIPSGTPSLEYQVPSGSGNPIQVLDAFITSSQQHRRQTGSSASNPGGCLSAQPVLCSTSKEIGEAGFQLACRFWPTAHTGSSAGQASSTGHPRGCCHRSYLRSRYHFDQGRSCCFFYHPHHRCCWCSSFWRCWLCSSCCFRQMSTAAAAAGVVIVSSVFGCQNTSKDAVACCHSSVLYPRWQYRLYRYSRCSPQWSNRPRGEMVAVGMVVIVRLAAMAGSNGCSIVT